MSEGRCINVGTCGRPLRYVDMELQGVWDEESYPADKVATFVCRPGYTQHGIIEKSCIGGEWKPVSNGRCQLKSCGPPGDIESGSFELVVGDDLVFGAVVEYVCDIGYKMVSGDKIRECGANGWTNKLPKCQDVNVCDPPPRAPELEIQGRWDAESYPVGTEVTFVCRPGYIQQGDIKKVCVDASWRAAPDGTCRKKPCGPPGDLQFGSFKLTLGDDFVFGAVVQYTCNKGYKMEENENTRECTNDGWTNAVPQCKVNKDPCEKPPMIRHGDFLEPGKVRYEVGSSLVYKCPDYYKMQGSATVTCLGGDWSDPPDCLEPCTVTVNAMSERNIILKVEGAQKIYSRHQDRIEFTCIQEYEIPDLSLLQVTCNRGMFQYPKCIKTGSCILSQDTMESRNIYINRNSEILPEETVRFDCKEGTLPENTLEAKCNMRKLNYPTCVIPSEYYPSDWRGIVGNVVPKHLECPGCWRLL
uniref:Sushi domain-containing protein n=1 Tax=Leptobrachium leishanense TaxID=445787 RepID=A0A8C5WMD8_9ANUR